MNALAKTAKAAGHDPQLEQENFKFSKRVLENHLSETARIFRLGNKPYAYWMTKATYSVCMSCHTQAPSSSRPFTEFSNQKFYTSELAQAEFLFATRAFDKAAESYNWMIENYGKSHSQLTWLEVSLKRMLAYYARIKRDPEAALAQFQKYKARANIPDHTKNVIDDWIAQIKNWKSNGKVDPKTMTDQQILSFIKKNLPEDPTPNINDAAYPNYVNYLYSSGVLYEFLQSHTKSKIVPQVLFWLAICERSVGSNFFFSLGDLYLHECITGYPADPIAKRCYKEYEDEMIMGYTGSSGTK